MKPEDDLFKIERQVQPLEKGLNLISEPFLSDRYFGQSVILITEHNSEGTVGFVVNKPLAFKIQELVPDFPEFDAPVSLGGPVGPGTVHFIHSIGPGLPGTQALRDDLYWGGDFGDLRAMIKTGLIRPDQIKFFVGYSGWSPGQLKSEVKRGSWVLSTLPGQELLPEQGVGFWRSSLEKLGPRYRLMSNFPEDPLLN